MPILEYTRRHEVDARMGTLIRQISRLFAVACLTAPAVLVPGPVASQDYDAINISGYTVPIADVRRLFENDLLIFETERRLFAFSGTVKTERALRQRMAAAGIDAPQAVLELYRLFNVDMPNSAAQTFTVPSGFGPVSYLPAGRPPVSLSFGVGGVNRVPYSDQADGAMSFGLGFGNGFDGIGAQIGFGFNDLSDLATDRIALSVSLSRYLTDGWSVAAGGENLAVRRTDSQASWYVAASRAFSPRSSVLPFAGSVTLGLGTGRFAEMLPRDAAAGRTGQATVVFGALAIALSDRSNLILDWNGRNLNAGVGMTLKDLPISVSLGVQDLTGRSGDGPRLSGAVSVTLLTF